jgi:tellurite resistance protein TehA-like permease
MGTCRLQPQQWVKNLNPGHFTIVMATGILSQAMLLDGADALSAALLVITIVAFGALVVLQAWRLVSYPEMVITDTRNPRQAYGFFSFTAASEVLASRLAGSELAVVLLVVGGLAWLVATCTVPLLVAGRPGALAGANGTWFLWAVGAQSIAVAVTSLRSPISAGLAALAIACWSVGVILYLMTAVVVVVALLSEPVSPADLTPSYWVFMGATAISALAGGRILQLGPDPFSTAVHEVASGLSVMLWSFGTWLIPLLLALGVWRHLIRRVSLAYEPGQWSVVFPVVMFGVGSRELGVAIRSGWLVTLGRYEAWLGLALWVAVAAGMAWRAGKAAILCRHA